MAAAKPERGPSGARPAADAEPFSVPALRHQAEAALRARAVPLAPEPNALGPDASEQTLHELRVHQIELEMQNEELQRRQEELNASNRRYFDLYDLAPVGYCTVNEAGLILQANLTACALLGFDRSALVQQPLSRFIFREDMDIYYLMGKALRKSGQAQTVELRMLKQDGTQFWAQVLTNLAQEPDGRQQLRLTLSDISERKHNAQRLELALMGADLGLWDIDVPSGALHLSARSCAMLGQPEGGVGPHISDLEKLVHPDDVPARRAATHAFMNGDVPYFQIEHRLRHKDGHWLWVRMQGRIVTRDENGVPLRSVGTLQDISQEKHLKREGADMLQRIESLIQDIGKAADAPPEPAPAPQATPIGAREQQVIQLIAAGCTSAEIGAHLGISTSTAATHRRNLMRKLDLHSAAELTRYAVAHKLISN